MRGLTNAGEKGQAVSQWIRAVAVTMVLTGASTASSSPDLTVISVTGPAIAGTAQYVTVTNVLSNAGADAALNWSYQIYLSPDGVITTNDTVLATQGTFASLPALTAVTNSVIVSIPLSAAIGTNYFGVVIDYDNAVSEVSETNNAMSSGPVAVSIGPDLTVVSVAGPSAAGTAQYVTLTNTLANLGLGAAGTWSYRIYRSSDAIITTHDTPLTTQGSFANFPAKTAVTNTDVIFIPAATATGTYYFGAIIDCDDQVVESNELNNAGASGPCAISIGPDLTVASVAGPAVAGTAQHVTLTNILANTGAGAAGNWSYRIYMSTDAVITPGDTFITTQGTFTGFPAKTVVTNSDVVFIPAATATGTYYFGAIIDCDDQVAESNELNNTGASGPCTIGIGPDLAVVSVKGPATAGRGQTVTLTNALANAGAGAAGTWNYRIYLSSDAVITTGDRILTTQGDFLSFPAGTTITNFDPVVIPADAPDGTNYFGVVIDFDNIVTESNELNNAGASGPATVGIGPDLTVLTVQGPAAAGRGQSVTLTNTLANAGMGAAGSWNYRIYLSSDAAITTNDTALTTQGYFVSFPAQSSVTNADVVVIPAAAPAGTNYFGVVIDFGNDVQETNEANNSGASGPARIGPIISAITYRTDSVLVSIAGLLASTTCSVEYATSLTGSVAWTTGSLFTAGEASTNFFDSASPSITTRFYRVRQQ